MSFSNHSNRPSKKISERDIVELLLLFSGKEFKNLSRYIYYQGTPGLCTFWDVVHKYHPTYDVFDLDIHSQISPNTPFNKNLFRVRLAELTRLIKEFLAIREFRQNQFLYSNLAAYALNEIGAQKNYRVQKAKNDKLINETNALNSEIYHYLENKEMTEYYHVIQFEDRKTTNCLEQSSHYQDLDYLLQKLRNLVFQRNRQFVVKDIYTLDTNHENVFLEYLESFNFYDAPIIHCYYLLLKVLQNYTDNQAIDTFYQYLMIHVDAFNVYESRQFLVCINNVFLWNIQLGNLQYIKYRFDLTKFMVEHDYLTVNGYFFPIYFRTVMRSAIEANELEWAEHFLTKYLPLTKTNNYNYLEALNKGLLFFAKKEIDKLEECLFLLEQSDDHKSDDPYDLIGQRNLKLKLAFIQLSDQPKSMQKEAFQGKINSYIKYVSRSKKISSSAIEKRVNFAKALRLVFLKLHGKKKVEGNLREQLIKLKPIIQLPWLLGLIDQIQTD